MHTFSTNIINMPPSKDLFRILPRGTFHTYDNRTDATGGWVGDIEALAANLNARDDYIEIDYNHARFKAPPADGTLAPAAGWIKRVEARADGLYATEVEWTSKAYTMITNREALYISPALIVDANGSILDILNVALVNDPAIKGLTRLASNDLTTLIGTRMKEDTTQIKDTSTTTHTNGQEKEAKIDALSAELAALIESAEKMAAKLEVLNTAVDKMVELLSREDKPKDKIEDELPAIESQLIPATTESVKTLSREQEHIRALLGVSAADFIRINS